MRASHWFVTALGIVGCLSIFLFIGSFGELVAADASDAPYTGLWVYAPYEGPGGRVPVRVFLQGGDGVSARQIEAAIDGEPAGIEDETERERRPSRRMDLGKRDIEFAVRLPEGLPPGPHHLDVSLEGSCAGSSFSRACGHVLLTAPLDVGSTTMRVWSVVQALLAALAVWGAARLGKRPVLAWAKGAGSSGGWLASAIIPALVVWGYASVWMFAKPLAAAADTSSDLFFGTAIVTWLLVLPVGLFWKRHAPAVAPAVSALVRFVPEASEEATGYRDATARPPRVASLEEVARFLQLELHIRLRRSGDRLVPRWIGGTAVRIEAVADPLPRGILRIDGPVDQVGRCVLTIAKKLGPVDLAVGEQTLRVEPDTVASEVWGILRARR